MAGRLAKQEYTGKGLRGRRILISLRDWLGDCLREICFVDISVCELTEAQVVAIAKGRSIILWLWPGVRVLAEASHTGRANAGEHRVYLRRQYR